MKKRKTLRKAMQRAKPVRKLTMSEAAYKMMAEELIAQGSSPDQFTIPELVDCCLELIQQCPADVKQYIADHS